jgi:hypothetical protein
LRARHPGKKRNRNQRKHASGFKLCRLAHLLFQLDDGKVAPKARPMVEAFFNRSRCHSTFGYNSPNRVVQDWIETPHEQQIRA